MISEENCLEQNFRDAMLILMERKGLSYGELGKITGIGKSALHNYAKGKRRIPGKRAVVIAAAFNKTADQMYRLEIGDE